MKRLTILTAAGSLLISASAVQAKVNMGRIAPAKVQTVMHERHEGMESIGKSFKAINRQLQASTPDMAEIRGAAASIDRLAKRADNWFPAGTGTDAGKTGAKPEIWANPKDFVAKLEDFQRAAVRYNGAVARGDAAAAKAGFSTFAKTCKACHDTYRKDMH